MIKDEFFKKCETNEFIPTWLVLNQNKTTGEILTVVHLNSKMEKKINNYNLWGKQYIYSVMERKDVLSDITDKKFWFTFPDNDEILEKFCFIGVNDDGTKYDSKYSALSLCFILKFACFYDGNDFTRQNIDTIQGAIKSTKENNWNGWNDPVFLKVEKKSFLKDLRDFCTINNYEFKIVKVQYIDDDPNFVKQIPIPTKTFGDLQNNIDWFFNYYIDKKYISHSPENEFRFMLKKKNVLSDEAIRSNDVNFQKIKRERHIEVQLPNTKMTVLEPK